MEQSTCNHEMQRRLPHARSREVAKFDGFAIRFVQEVVEQRMELLISSRNALVLRHGQTWEFAREDQSTHKGGLELSSAESVIHFEAVVNNDLEAFRENLHSIVEQFISQMSRKVYETVSEGASEVGNVVSAAESDSLAEAFVEMIEKIEFGVDEQGRVTLPSIHARPEYVDAMMEELNAQGPDFEQRVEDIKKKKAAEAIQREQDRRARFKRYDP